MALPFLPHCSSVTTQEHLLYLIQLQSKRVKRTCGHNYKEPISLLRSVVSEKSPTLSPDSSVATRNYQDGQLNQTQANQPKLSVAGALHRLRHSRSTEDHQSAKRSRISAKRRVWRGKQSDISSTTETFRLDDLHWLDGEDRADSEEEYKKGNHLSHSEEGQSTIQAFSRRDSSKAPSKKPNTLLSPQVIWPRSEGLERKYESADYRATALFRHCSELLTSPFASEFSLDPIKLAYPSPLLSCPFCLRDTITKPFPTKPIRVLDVGGVVADNYVKTLTSIPHLHVLKAVVKQTTNFSYLRHRFYSPTQHPQSLPETPNVSNIFVDRPWRLPFPSQSLDIITTRSLHQDIMERRPIEFSSTSVGNSARAKVMESLREFYRLITVGGSIEYIYFEKGLQNAGPLMEQLEPFFYSAYQNSSAEDLTWDSDLEDGWQGIPAAEREHRTVDAAGHADNTVSVEEFLGLVEEVGFEVKQKTVMMFPVLVLSALYTPAGYRREFTASIGTSVSEYKDPDMNAWKLLNRVQSECTASSPGWKCVVGWARKVAASDQS